VIRTPSVEIAIPTHARVAWLEEALHSALSVEHPDGPESVSVLVYNDCPEQVLGCDHPRVRVVNLPVRFHTLGNKLNAMLEEVRGEWVAFLDDDDILMPWHLRRIGVAVAAGAKTASASHKLWFDGDRGSVDIPSIMDFCVDARYARACGGFAALDNRQEHAFVANLERIEPIYRVDTQRDPSYLYIWGNGVHHVSGTGDPHAGIGFRADAVERLRSGKEPSGRINLRPHWRKDYLAMAKAVIARDAP